MKLCKHDNYRVIDWIKEPKYSTDEILINATAIYKGTEHYIIKFSKCKQYPEWFYMGRTGIVKHKTQKNGAGSVYVVPMSEKKAFEPVKNCKHVI